MLPMEDQEAVAGERKEGAEEEAGQQGGEQEKYRERRLSPGPPAGPPPKRCSGLVAPQAASEAHAATKVGSPSLPSIVAPGGVLGLVWVICVGIAAMKNDMRDSSERPGVRCWMD